MSVDSREMNRFDYTLMLRVNNRSLTLRQAATSFFAKVMFSLTSVILFTGGGVRVGYRRGVCGVEGTHVANSIPCRDCRLHLLCFIPGGDS